MSSDEPRETESTTCSLVQNQNSDHNHQRKTVKYDAGLHLSPQKLNSIFNNNRRKKTRKVSVKKKHYEDCTIFCNCQEEDEDYEEGPPQSAVYPEQSQNLCQSQELSLASSKIVSQRNNGFYFHESPNATSTKSFDRNPFLEDWNSWRQQATRKARLNQRCITGQPLNKRYDTGERRQGTSSSIATNAKNPNQIRRQYGQPQSFNFEKLCNSNFASNKKQQGAKFSSSSDYSLSTCPKCPLKCFCPRKDEPVKNERYFTGRDNRAKSSQQKNLVEKVVIINERYPTNPRPKFSDSNDSFGLGQRRSFNENSYGMEKVARDSPIEIDGPFGNISVNDNVWEDNGITGSETITVDDSLWNFSQQKQGNSNDARNTWKTTEIPSPYGQPPRIFYDSASTLDEVAISFYPERRRSGFATKNRFSYVAASSTSIFQPRKKYGEPFSFSGMEYFAGFYFQPQLKSQNSNNYFNDYQTSSYKYNNPSRFKKPPIVNDQNNRPMTLFFTRIYCFSNHFQCDRLEIDGIHYLCTEQYYMFYKAKVFGDREKMKAIMCETDPKKMKWKGTVATGFNQDEWFPVSIQVMVAANFYKYEQNKVLRRQLFETNETQLVEANPTDERWGVKLAIDDPLIRDRRCWRGLNLMGNILTRLRDRLKVHPKYVREYEALNLNNEAPNNC